MKAGWQTDSKRPSSVRTVTRPAKLEHAAVHARTAPQHMMLKPRYFPIGTLNDIIRIKSRIVTVGFFLVDKPGDDPVLRVFHNQDGDVDACCKPLIFLSHQVRIIDYAPINCQSGQYAKAKGEKVLAFVDKYRGTHMILEKLSVPLSIA